MTEVPTMANKTILFVTPELSYSGTPRSTLRMCKVARQIGYNVAVWSAEPGPFEKEYLVQYKTAKKFSISIERMKYLSILLAKNM